MRAPLSIALAAGLACCGGSRAGAPGGLEADELRSRPGRGAVEGAVRDVAADRPVSFAELEVTDEESGRLAGRGTTDHAGRYRIPDLTPGRYRVAATFASLSAEARGVVVMADRITELDLALSSHRPASDSERAGRREHRAELGAIEGVLLDGVRGEPLEGATVEVSSPRLVDPLFTIADEEGRFRVSGLHPGTYLVSIYYSLVGKGNIEIRRSGVEVERGETTELSVELDTELR